ncbi:MAG: bifunctional acetate--CoA ligase family protein/GNAT family N-acetyltransferase [Burkholderiales bacterium]|nr:bifunctional acetate--CoA ligase family protein/GNAT family N-acetyltransferase [Burkholderiales bacterium]
MTAHPLTPLFAPRSIAVVGASDAEGSVGRLLWEHLRDGGFAGPLHAVNPNSPRVGGVTTVPNVAALTPAPDLAILATPATTLAALVEDCADAGIRAVAIVSGGVDARTDAGRRTLARVRRVARERGVRVLGPNALGLMRPSARLDATFGPAMPRPGSVALVTQSGGLASATLDWATADGVGFSSVISLGNQLDVDFADALDWLALDPATESIVLYVEGIVHARRFMSALRAAARIKPVIVLKSGRGTLGSRVAVTHTDALIGADDVCDAALRRAGAVRVDTFVQLFSAAKCLSSRYRARGHRLAIVTNGGGPAVMAADRAQTVGLALAALAPATVDALDRALPPGWSRDNPVDLLEDADVARYRAALDAVVADAGVDSVLVIVTPQGMTDAASIADTVIAAAKSTRKQVMAVVMGEASTAVARARLQAAQLPTFRTPEPAIEAFSNVATFYVNQKLLMRVPGPLSRHAPPDIGGAQTVIDGARAAGRSVLTEMESKAVLAAFRIPVAPTVAARDVSEAVAIAQQQGFPVVMKVRSPDLVHKSEVGGVVLDIRDAAGVRRAFTTILERVRSAAPQARVDGVVIEPMIRGDHGREVMVGMIRDPVFGPAITCGAGGTHVELFADRAVALPPLDERLARTLLDATRVRATLDTWRGLPPADLDALEALLLRVSEMVCELPWLASMDINPVIVGPHGATVADARIVIAPPSDANALDRYAHMAIGPYPTHLERTVVVADGRVVTLRAIRPEDAAMTQAFVRGLSDETRFFRFFNAVHELGDAMLARFTQIDYDRELALVAVTPRAAAAPPAPASDADTDPGIGDDEELGVARYAIAPDGEACEFAVVVADRAQGTGLGRQLMAALIDAARARGLRTMEGSVLGANGRMLSLMERLGFDVLPDPDDAAMKRVVKRL